jgi:hypothetical protein
MMLSRLQYLIPFVKLASARVFPSLVSQVVAARLSPAWPISAAKDSHLARPDLTRRIL